MAWYWIDDKFEPMMMNNSVDEWYDDDDTDNNNNDKNDNNNDLYKLNWGYLSPYRSSYDNYYISTMSYINTSI